MKKFKLNKKLLFGGLASIIGLSTVAAVVAACASSGSEDNPGNGSNPSNPGAANNGFYTSQLTETNFYVKSSGDTNNEYAAAYQRAISDGARFLSAIAFTNNKPLSEAFKNNKITENTVATLIDDRFTGEVGKDRVSSVTFRTDEGGFLAGIAAAYYLNSNQDAYVQEGKLKWGAFVGLNFGSTTSFAQGFKFGILWANARLGGKQIKQEGSEATKTWVNVEQVAKDNVEFLSGSFAPNSEKADTIVKTLITEKANVILPIAGPQTSYAATNVANSSNKAFVVGVDSEQEKDTSVNTRRTTNNTLTNGRAILFSIIKRVDLAVIETAKKAIEASPLTGDLNKDVYKLGVHTSAGLNQFSKVNDEYLVGVSTAGIKYLVEAVKLTNAAATDQQKVIDELKKDEIYQLFNVKKTEQELSTYLTKTSDPSVWTLKQEHRNKQPLELQKLLGGNVYVHGNQVYTYDLTESGYLDSATTQTSTAFKQVWDAAPQNQKDKLVKIVLGQASAVLRDQSFSQSAYEGLIEFFKAYKVNIPKL